MKLNKWLFGAAAALMLGACSDNFADAPSSPEEVPAEKGQGYIGINVQMPTDRGTRANDVFGDGELSEYEINEAVLVLFQGDDAPSAKCIGTFTLHEAQPTSVTNPQVTRHSFRVASVSGITAGKRLYALVLANGINRVYNEANLESFMYNCTVKDFQEKVLETVELFEQDRRGKDAASNIFMANSPLSETKGGTEQIGTMPNNSLQILVELNPKVYKTESEAVEKPAGVVHVERIVGKVTCSTFPETTGIIVKVNDVDYTLKVDSVWWDMAQDMKKTYMVRNTNRKYKGKENDNESLWLWNYATTQPMPDPSIGAYRMIGGNGIASKISIAQTEIVDGKEELVKDNNGNIVYTEGNTNYYRPYFCQVPGYGVALQTGTVENEDGTTDKIYSSTYEDKSFNKTKMEFKDAVPWSGLTNTGVFYPLENTFPVEFMKYANTTRIGFWVKFKFVGPDGKENANLMNKNFYIKGLDKSVLYLDQNGLDPLTNNAMVVLSNNKVEDGKTVWDYPQLWAAIDNAIDKSEKEPGFISGVKLYDLVNIEYKPAKDGSISIKNITFKTKAQINAQNGYSAAFASEIDYTFDDTVIAKLNEFGRYTKYNLGRAFYEVRIKHFGDDLTPWLGEQEQATTIDQSYGTIGENGVTTESRKQDYLGRYGIVRNNWYDINVRTIGRLGDPKDPAEYDANWPGKPDDNKDQYIAVELRVLSWARRNQNVDF